MQRQLSAADPRKAAGDNGESSKKALPVPVPLMPLSFCLKNAFSCTGAEFLRVNENELTGRISSILPTIEGGIVTFKVKLDDKSNNLLRSNLRVDVFVILGVKEKILRVPLYPASIA